MLENFQQQGQIANKNIINELVPAFSDWSPENQGLVGAMSESDQRQQLVDKIHLTNNTISVFKKEVEELKKKRKKAIECLKPKKAKKYSHEVAEKEGIIKSLGLALSRHAKELERISLVGVDSPTELTYAEANEDSDKSSV